MLKVNSPNRPGETIMGILNNRAKLLGSPATRLIAPVPPIFSLKPLVIPVKVPLMPSKFSTVSSLAVSTPLNKPRSTFKSINCSPSMVSSSMCRRISVSKESRIFIENCELESSDSETAI